MDSKTLNREQLQQLVRFIHSRGFREDVVMLEILDHFACKVEEVIAKTPEVSFDEAMRKAHASFGAMGFQPIAASFQKQTKKKYSGIFWRHFKALLLNPILVVLLWALSVLYFKAFMLAEARSFRGFFDVNYMLLALFISYIALDLVILSSLTKKQRHHPYAQATFANGRIMGFTILVLYPPAEKVHDLSVAWIPALVFSV